MTDREAGADRSTGWRRRSAVERWMRLSTGLIMFSYAATHLISHACGLFLLDSMERVGRGILLAPWRTGMGRGLLIGSLLLHGTLGLVALARRRSLAMPGIEAAQVTLGLLIPLLIIPHVANVRLGASLYGLDDSYFRILYQYWITSPAAGLTRQFALMTVLWTHGCLGLHMLLRFRPWYRRWSGALLAIAIAIPVLAMLGIVNAGWNTATRAMLEPGFSALHGPPPPGTPEAAQRQRLESLWEGLQLAYIGLVVAVIAYRAGRRWYGRRYRGVTITYPGKPVSVPRGFSILEASRSSGIPHASMCGGRARCSTCRVRVVRGLADLPPADALERGTLDRIRASPEVRLACQTRPTADLTVLPLVPVGPKTAGLRIAFEQGVEHIVTALAVDLRGSTQLAAGKLPFDTLYVINRYIGCVTAAIEAHGGYVTSVAGDGVMSVFGADGNAAAAAAGAMAAALDIWDGLALLEREMIDELLGPLRFGLGLHTGVAIVGAVALSGRSSLQFLGDTGNVASRLEALTKDMGCVLLISRQVFETGALEMPLGASRETVVVRGREDAAIEVAAVSNRHDLAAIIGRGAAA